MVLEDGFIAFTQIGDVNCLDPDTATPVLRPMYASTGKAVGPSSILFVSEASVSEGDVDSYGLAKRVEPVVKCRGVSKADVTLNDALSAITIDPKTYRVRADGEDLICEPAKVVPLARCYSIF
jgi:urease subunit alpha